MTSGFEASMVEAHMKGLTPSSGIGRTLYGASTCHSWRRIAMRLEWVLHDDAVGSRYLAIQPCMPHRYLAHAAHYWLSKGDAQNLQSALKLLTGVKLDSIGTYGPK
eukprot:6444158-Amphidinium_carterae.1